MPERFRPHDVSRVDEDRDVAIGLSQPVSTVCGANRSTTIARTHRRTALNTSIPALLTGKYLTDVD